MLRSATFARLAAALGVIAVASCSGGDDPSFSATTATATSSSTSTSDATTTSSSTTTSGNGGAGGSGGGIETGGGGAGGGECVDASDCPPPPAMCFEATCVRGECGTGPSPALTPVPDPFVGDCLGLVCDGAGMTTPVPVLDDPSDDGNDCTLDVCDDGVPSYLALPSGSPCNGGVCDGLGSCVGGVCPTGMIDVGTHCIDPTEVTVAAYLAFLGGPDPGQSAVCSWNASYVPAGGAPPSSQLPMTNVDWCDAAAYCASVGKRLCGKIGGGSTPAASYADAAVSQWQAVCSSGGTTTYPYGNAFQASACNGAGAGFGSPQVPQTLANCRGALAPYDAVYDMSGNVWEWEDSCVGAAGMGDSCRLRGGSFNNGMGSLDCATDYSVPRQSAYSSVGFRCCSP